jgi:hypothetical protein
MEYWVRRLKVETRRDVMSLLSGSVPKLDIEDPTLATIRLAPGVAGSISGVGG